jgi:hypothetical protein
MLHHAVQCYSIADVAIACRMHVLDAPKVGHFAYVGTVMLRLFASVAANNPLYACMIACEVLAPCAAITHDVIMVSASVSSTWQVWLAVGNSRCGLNTVTAVAEHDAVAQLWCNCDHWLTPSHRNRLNEVPQ